ncbi:MAG: hypothetical protein QHG99_05170 [Methanomicrobiales archaeon]|nr:hypothetical protein [Methanomicrobiales archaeon]
MRHLSPSFNMIAQGEQIFSRDERARSDFECRIYAAYDGIMISCITGRDTVGRCLIPYDEKRMTTRAGVLMGTMGRFEEPGRMRREDLLKDPHLMASTKYHPIVAREVAIGLADHLIPI